MRKSLAVALGALAIGGFVGMQAISHAQEAEKGENAEKAEKAEKGEKHEGHPVIHHAIEQVERVKAELGRADKDFEGHREAAVKHLDEALEELHKCMEVDKK